MTTPKMTPPERPERTSTCRAPGCEAQSTTVAKSEMLGDIDVCQLHADELNADG